MAKHNWVLCKKRIGVEGSIFLAEQKFSKNNHVLDLYVRLFEGKIINKTEEAKKFGLDERSIQRDIDDIRAFFRGAQDGQGIGPPHDRI